MRFVRYPSSCDTNGSSLTDSRYILLPVVLHHLHIHLQEQKDLIMCARILSNVFCLIKKNSSVSTAGQSVWFSSNASANK